MLIRSHVAIQRYCAARIEDNQLRIRHSRLQHSVGLAIVLGVVTIALNRMSELFCAPKLNPFSTKPVDLRGESGLAYLHRRARLRWLRPFPATQLTIQLPAEELPTIEVLP